MLSFSQMLTHLVVALALGALMGLERELVHKEAGIRTNMMLAVGAAVFAMIGLQLPYLVADGNLNEILARNSGFMAVIANIVIGVGFLGAGAILKSEHRVHGLTTAAVMWVTAGVGTLAGLGLLKFALAVTIVAAGSLYILRKLAVLDKVSHFGE